MMNKKQLTGWEKAIFYPELKGKNHQQLHEIAFEQITETITFMSNDRSTLLAILWRQWEEPVNIRSFLKQLNESIQDFDWEWFNKWDNVFGEMGAYPYTWSKYKTKKATQKEIKIALLYHSIHSRFATLRRYEDHYAIQESNWWSKAQYQIELVTLEDDPIEKEIVEAIKAIKNNVILSLPPYIPAGRASIRYKKVRE